jgi:murein L,D-transpeptidase YcbB/YkuD
LEDAVLRSPRLFPAAACLVVGCAARVTAQPAAEAQPAVVQTIREVVARAEHPDLKWPEFPHYKDELQGLYEPIGYAPFWFADGKPRKQARQAIDVLRESPLRGLDPEDYDVAYLESLWDKLESGQDLPPLDLGRFDTGLSVAYMRQISDVRIGRITPSRVQVEIDPSTKKYDLPARVRQAVDSDRIQATVEAAEPQLALYTRTKQALAAYRRLQGMNLPPVSAAQTLRPGDSFAGLAALRARLVAYGDVDSGGSGTSYSGEIVEGVRRFQARHGLAPDGVLGKGTLAAINAPVSRRVRQIELGLERLRWVPDLAGESFVAVNIPAFQLWAFDSRTTDGSASVTMRVVVGKSFKSSTPVFLERMEYIVFRPYWNVPYSIARGELVPALRRDAKALAKRDMEIVRGFGDKNTLPATRENIDRIASGALKVRQRPGPSNSLGLAKFIFPNSSNVYLHGTPGKAAFERPRRDLSHGCVRLEDPARLARFVLREQPEWTDERIEAAMNGPEPKQVNLGRHMPVLLFYTTALVDLQGKVHFFEDIYGHDARLERELESAYPYQP